MSARGCLAAAPSAFTVRAHVEHVRRIRHENPRWGYKRIGHRLSDDLGVQLESKHYQQLRVLLRADTAVLAALPLTDVHDGGGGEDERNHGDELEDQRTTSGRCHTVALLLPRADAKWIPMFYRLLTATMDGYVQVHPPDLPYPLNGLQIRVSTGAYPLSGISAVYLCRGSPFARCSDEPNTMTGGEFVGYTSTYAVMMFYGEVLRRG